MKKKIILIRKDISVKTIYMGIIVLNKIFIIGVLEFSLNPWVYKPDQKNFDRPIREIFLLQAPY